MLDTPYTCKCGGTLVFYDIGFDDGYQCKKCHRIYEWDCSELVKQREQNPHMIGQEWLTRLHVLLNREKAHEIQR